MAGPYYSCRMKAMDTERYAEAKVEIALAQEKLNSALSSEQPGSIAAWSQQARGHLKRAIRALELFELGDFEEPKKD